MQGMRSDARGGGTVLPAEVNGGVAVVLCVGRRRVAMREGAEERVSEQAGYLNLRQSDGRSVSRLKQRDGLKNTDTLHHHRLPTRAD